MRSPNRLRALTVAALLASCRTAAPVQVTPPPAPAKPPAPPDPAASARAAVAPLREDAKAVQRAQAELTWKVWTTGEAVDPAEATKGHEALFTPDAVAKIRALEAVAKGDEAKAARALELYVVGEIVARETAASADAAAALEGGASFTSSGQTVALRELEQVLASELNTEKRRNFYKASLPAVRKVSGALADREKKAAAVLATLGFATPQAWEEALRGISVDDAAKLAEAVLVATQEPWTAAMNELATRELRLKLADLNRADVPRLFRVRPDSDAAFPKDRLVPDLKALFTTLGVDPDETPGLHLDTELRPKKSPRALCVAVQSPSDVRLSLKPRGGLLEATQALRESGRALSALLVRTDVFEFAQLGSHAVPDTFAALFDSLMEEPAFIAARGLSGDKLTAYVRKAAARRLFRVRSAAGAVLFEKARAGAAEADLPKLYAASMSRAWGFAVSEEEGERFRFDTPPWLGAVDDLRAAVASAQLATALSAKKPEWWTEPASAQTLAPLAASGGRTPFEELARAAGMAPLDPAPLAARFAAHAAFTKLEEPAAKPPEASPAPAPPAATPPAEAPKEPAPAAPAAPAKP